MELKEYFRIVLRWLWLLILGLALGAAGGYFFSSRQTPVYQSTTRILVMSAPQNQTYYDPYWSDLQMTQRYIQLATSQPVLKVVGDELGYPVKAGQIKVQQVGDTQVIQLTVQDGDPERAAAIANQLVNAIIDQNEKLQTRRFKEAEDSLQTQITQVQSQINALQLQVNQISVQTVQEQLGAIKAQIDPLQEEVSTLQQEIAGLEAEQAGRKLTAAALLANKTQIAEKQARLDEIKPLLTLYQQIQSDLVVLGKPSDVASNDNARLAQLQSTLDLYQQLYINLLSSREDLRLTRLQNTPDVAQMEEAVKAGSPISPRPLQNTLLAAAVGLMLAAGVVFLIEYLDDSLKTPEDVERALGVPVLGFVAEMQYKNKSAEEVYVARQPRSPVSEAFRSLRTNLEFASVQKPIRTILVTSPGPSEGKTTISVNLAAIIALSGKRVALVDADLRRPHVHRFLDLPNRNGLSNLFRIRDAASSVSRTKLELPNLIVITSGGLPPNPAELLGSERMSEILKELTEMVDVVVVDTPPSLVADAQILAAKVDAVLLVIQPGGTHTDVARSSFELFKRAGARVIGTVMNRIPRNRGYYYGGYKYYSPYSESKGYYAGNETQPAVNAVKEAGPSQLEPTPTYSFLQKVAKLSNPMPLEELPPPDPPKR